MQLQNIKSFLVNYCEREDIVTAMMIVNNSQSIEDAIVVMIEDHPELTIQNNQLLTCHNYIDWIVDNAQQLYAC